MLASASLTMAPKKAAAAKAKAGDTKGEEVAAADASKGSSHNAKGDGMDPAAVSRMLGLLKYRANPDTNKKGQDMDDAKAGLELYQGLAAAEKKQFLQEFESNGRGKKKGSLGFVLSYKKKFSQEHTQEVATEENFFTLAQILEMNGLRWGDFKKEQAIAIGLQLVEDNKEEFGHDGSVKKHAKMDFLDKYYYIKQGGLVKKRKLSNKEELSKLSEKSGEIAKLGLEGNLSLQDIGGCGESSGSATGGPVVKQEHAGQDKFVAKVALLKVAVAGMQKLSLQGNTLQKRFAVVGRTDEAMKIKGSELQTKMKGFDEFLDKCATKLIENEEVGDNFENIDIPDEIQSMEKLIGEAEHRTGGCEEMMRRFTSMLGK